MSLPLPITSGIYRRRDGKIVRVPEITHDTLTPRMIDVETEQEIAVSDVYLLSGRPFSDGREHPKDLVARLADPMVLPADETHIYLRRDGKMVKPMPGVRARVLQLNGTAVFRETGRASVVTGTLSPEDLIGVVPPSRFRRGDRVMLVQMDHTTVPDGTCGTVDDNSPTYPAVMFDNGIRFGAVAAFRLVKLEQEQLAPDGFGPVPATSAVQVDDPHLTLKALYALDVADSTTPWERWEYFSPSRNTWATCATTPEWVKRRPYRRKPDLAPVTLPLKAEPALGTEYFTIILGEAGAVRPAIWEGSDRDKRRLRRHLAYETREQALEKAQSLITLLGGKF